ncbi:MAG: PD40 domain-containing protein [Sphingobacteriaceae bacterium]|nr:PD40 domain-containing protein [Sphingobacteriaceae bacterium]
MYKFVITLLILSSSVFAQTEGSEGEKKDKKSKSLFKDAGDLAKFGLAKQKMYAGQYLSAINLYREIEHNDPNNASVIHYIGYCNSKMNKFDKAKEYFLKAIATNNNVKPETHVELGKIYQMEENFDKAIEEFTLFKNAPSKDEDSNEDADVLLSQCQNAKKYMANPIDVVITNMGQDINGPYDDKNPCISADGSRMVFTSRRPKNTDSPVDAEGDGKYFEDIYYSDIDSTHNFGKAVDMGSSINTKGHDACTSISPDGKQIFIYKNDAADKRSIGGEVYVSKISNGKWRTPAPIGKPISSMNWEGGACVSPDGKKYFFFSERKGGVGRSDIYMVVRKNKQEWEKPVNLGAGVNTVFDEGAVFLAPDGKTLFFCSNGPSSMGSYDIFKTVYENGKWSEPVNLGYPINTSGREGQITLSADAKTAYISSDRKGGLGESDIYKIDLKDYAILETDGKKVSNNGLSILKGTIRDGNEGYGIIDVDIEVQSSDGKQVASTSTNEAGEYFLTLKAGSYKLKVSKKGFQEVVEDIELKLGEKEAFTLEKGYLLKK